MSEFDPDSVMVGIDPFDMSEFVYARVLQAVRAAYLAGRKSMAEDATRDFVERDGR